MLRGISTHFASLFPEQTVPLSGLFEQDETERKLVSIRSSPFLLRFRCLYKWRENISTAQKFGKDIEIAEGKIMFESLFVILRAQRWIKTARIFD